MADLVFKKNDIAVAKVSLALLLTRAKRYTVLGVKQLPSHETVIRIVTDNKKRQYLDSSLFVPLTEAMSEEEKAYRDDISNRKF